MPRAARIATTASEYALYALLLLQPALGLLHTNANAERVNWFLLGDIPPVIGTDHGLAETFLRLHGAVATTLLVLIGLHAAAGLIRHFHHRDNALRGMLPDWS